MLMLGGAALALSLSGCASGRPTAGGVTTMGGGVARLVTPDLTRDWPDHARDAATAVEMKYGPPAESALHGLVWHRTGQWKRTVVFATEVPHAFPVPHSDVIEQTIDYRVPVDRIDDLAVFNGSITVYRTGGELTVRCENEALNFLALNLANDIVVERRTVQQARQEFARRAAEYASGQSHPYTEGLVFRIPAVGTADADRPVTRNNR
jgi:hypothetical protein